MPHPEYLQLVRAADSGDQKARERLFAALYDELHRLAERELRRHSSATLSPTTLLHETFLNIGRRDSMVVDCQRFISYAARVMRGLVIDHFRDRKTQKRGGQFEITSLTDDTVFPVSETADLEKLSDALDSLGAIEPRLAECVDLKFFCGFSFRDIAQLWNVSERTVQRDWEKARLMLNRLIGGLGLE